MRLGAQIVQRDIFLDALEESIHKETDLGVWDEWQWQYDVYNKE